MYISSMQTDRHGRTEGRTERHYKAKGCFSQFCDRAYNLIRTVSERVPSDSITFKLNPYRHSVHSTKVEAPTDNSLFIA
jgi:hypothetical protein